VIVINCDPESKEWLDIEATEIRQDIPPTSFFDGKDKTLVIIDDYEMSRISHEQLRRLTTLMRFISSHKNTSVMALYQSFFKMPKIVRDCTDSFIIWKVTSSREMNAIAKATGCNPSDISYIFKKLCPGPYDNLLIDDSVNAPCRLRKNLFECIHPAADDDDD